MKNRCHTIAVCSTLCLLVALAPPVRAQTATYQTTISGNVRAAGVVPLACDADQKNCAPSSATGAPSGPLYTRAATSSTSTNAQVAASVSAVALLAANANRLGATIYYDGSAVLYVLEGSGTPSSTNYTIKLGTGFFTSYEAPAGWVGPIQGVWSAASGAAAVTERTQ